MHPHSCFLVLKLPHFLSLPESLPPPSKLQPPSGAMVSDLSSSRLYTESDLRKLRWVIGWQSPRFDQKMWHGVAPLTGMRPSEFVYFALYALSRLMLPFSSFLFMLLEYYGLQLQHLSPQSITLVAIFVHLCEMYVCVQPSVRHSSASTCCALLGGTQPPSFATTSSTRPRVHLCTSLPLALTSGTTGGRTG
jgi:hypothetical protein